MSLVSLQFTLLGTGSSGGVPRIGNDWGVCDPEEPRNRRLRCAAMVERIDPSSQERTRILIDTAPDMRLQLLTCKVDRIDGVFYTHDHADQTGGIDDLRVLSLRQRARIPVHMDEETSQTLTHRASYCFEGRLGYPPILDLQPYLKALEPRRIDGPSGEIELLPVQQVHGQIGSLGFRVGGFAYCNDLNALPEASIAALRGVDTLILDALRHTPHPSHFTVAEAIETSRTIGARRTVLTNMHIDLDYQILRRSLPDGIEPGYDGMSMKLPLSL